MSKFNIPTVSAICPACSEETLHRLTFEDAQVRHLRCESCSAAHVCAYKGSFHAGLHPMDFADVIKSQSDGEIQAYRSSTAFQPRDVFEHPSFGVGYVLAVLSPPKKMDVMFEDKNRYLVCGPGSGVEAEVEAAPSKRKR